MSEQKHEKTITQQHFKDQCDINKIVQRAQKMGGMLPPAIHPPQYADVSSVPDYQAAMNTVIRANELFESLPSKIRERFRNDPAKMMEFLKDRDNLAEAQKLGLVTVTVTDEKGNKIPLEEARQNAIKKAKARAKENLDLSNVRDIPFDEKKPRRATAREDRNAES